MASLNPLFDRRNRRRPDFGHPTEPCHVGANHRDYIYTHQTPQLHRTKPSSPPVILGDDAAATIEWKETPEAHIFKTHLPNGLRREDVRVQIEDDEVLKIIGERVVEAEDRYRRHVEVSRGRFLTSLKLPEDARADLISSYWENGALTVKIPRREVIHQRHHVRNVEIISDGYRF